MTSASARKGDAFENVIVGYLREQLGANITRHRTSPVGDRGDLAGIPNFTLEVKNHRKLADAINVGMIDLCAEQDNAGTRHGAIIAKRFGKSDPGEALFVMRLEDALPILREMGWDT